MGKTNLRVSALDTCALCHLQNGMSSDALPIAKKTTAKIQLYLHTLREDGGSVILPSLVMAEYLVKFDQKDWELLVESLLSQILIIPFDDAAAQCFAKIRRDVSLDAIRTSTGQSAPCMKIDCLIAAMAISHGANEILTSNRKDFNSISSVKLRVININDLPSPNQTLFEYEATQS